MEMAEQSSAINAFRAILRFRSTIEFRPTTQQPCGFPPFTMKTGTTSQELELGTRLPRGRLKEHIEAVLAVQEAATIEQFVAKLPRSIRRFASDVSIRYQVGVMVQRDQLVRVFQNAFVLADEPVLWRVVLQNTRPQLFNVMTAMGNNWVTPDRLMQKLGPQSKLSATQLGTALRKLKSLGLVTKSGKSDWCVTRRFDMPYTTKH